MTKEEYNKTWYWGIIHCSKPFPNNWITVTPIKIFGWFTGFYKVQLAKSNYPWSKEFGERN